MSLPNMQEQAREAFEEFAAIIRKRDAGLDDEEVMAIIENESDVLRRQYER